MQQQVSMFVDAVMGAGCERLRPWNSTKEQKNTEYGIHTTTRVCRWPLIDAREQKTGNKKGGPDLDVPRHARQHSKRAGSQGMQGRPCWGWRWMVLVVQSSWSVRVGGWCGWTGWWSGLDDFSLSAGFGWPGLIESGRVVACGLAGSRCVPGVTERAGGLGGLAAGWWDLRRASACRRFGWRAGACL